MLAYRHVFHAGNHADVLKHTVLLALLKYLQAKDKPLHCVDTHAGAALHALHDAGSNSHREHDTGIGRLWDQADESLPPLLQDYRSAIRGCNPDGQLQRYPGSAHLLSHRLRAHDRLWLFEKHPSEQVALQRYFHGHDKVQLRGDDGFEGLRAVLPPVSRRGLILIDPAYEDKQDYRAVVSSVKAGLERFATGTYAIWYPMLTRDEARKLPDRLTALLPGRWLHAQLQVRGTASETVRMLGSGMVVLNPPYTLRPQLEPAMVWLAKNLSQDDGARWAIDSKLD